MSSPSFSLDSLQKLGALTPEKSGGWRLFVHVQPGAKTTEFVGLHGGRAKIRLAAPPVDGKANKALIAWVAKRLGVPKLQVTIVRGQNARKKTLAIMEL